MSRFQTLQTIITTALSDTEDSHWESDGSVSLRAVSDFSGFDDVTRSELNKFGRTRRRIATAEELERAAAPRPAPNTKAVTAAARDVEAAARALDDARVAQAGADRAARAARAGLATALTEWSAAHPPTSDSQMRREYIASEQALKQAIKDGTRAPPAGPIPGNSVVDRTAVYSAGARRGRVAGQGDAFRRGAGPTRGLRLPSQR
jgi:hypothetical protein